MTEPPSNGGYLLAAYIVAPTILLGYWVRLLRLAQKLRPGSRGLPGTSAPRNGR